MWMKGKMMSDVTSRNSSENSNKPKSLPSSLIRYEQEEDDNNERNQLCGLGVRPGMECMPLRSPTGPYNHYHHVADQTKSLQELQNEVGALLEFRDLVIETFPDLKTKMSSSATNSTITGIPSSSSLASRREWEPGIRVRRKLTQKENSEISSSSLIRSRSNSHSGKKEPKSGEGNGSVIQDSGFSTETSSSKETHSASSTTGAVQASTVTTSTTATSRLQLDSDDELWNLLDVIHRKSNRLRDEVEHLQNMERERCHTGGSNSPPLPPTSFKKQLERVNKDDVQILRKERDRLLDKLSEMEAETISERIRASKKQDEIDGLFSAKRDLEDQLRTALSQKLELNSRIHDLHLQFVNKSAPSSPDSGKSPPRLPIMPGARKSSADISSPANLQSPSGASASSAHLLLHINSKNRINSSFQPVVVANTSNNKTAIDFTTASTTTSRATNNLLLSDQKQVKNDLNLGRLDGLVSSPNRTSKVSATDSKKIAAILLETNIVELQRHLLTITVQNQLLLQRLEQATRSKIFLMKKLDKSREEIDELKFQLEERNIELEGTRAQLRVIESKSNSRSEYSTPEHHRCSTTILLNTSSSRDSSTLRLSQTQISTPSMKAMVPLAMDEVLQHSSSTESAQDQTERDCSSSNNNSRTTITYPDTPKRRPPSKIPLPGSKGIVGATTPSPTAAVAPKPPTGRNYVATHHRSTSGPPSNRSLTKSTGSLQGGKSSGPPSTTGVTINSSAKKEIPSLTRADMTQSWRKDTSLERSRSSSIPISSTTKTSPLAKTQPAQSQHHHTNNLFATSQHQQISASPLPKPKRDTLTNKVKHLDSLSRLQQQTLASSTTTLNNNNNYKFNNTKRDLNLSTNNLLSTNPGVVIRGGNGGSGNDYKNKSTVPIRRGSSASMGRNATGVGGENHQQQQDGDNGKTPELEKLSVNQAGMWSAERKQSLGYDWHPECLRCEECGKRLNPGQHAEHKGVPYCHVPCYGALFGPQLFGHGTRVESHKSYGQKGAAAIRAAANGGGPALPRSHIESKVKFYNHFFDNKTNQIRSREVNGRFVLEGALKIYWGVQGIIHLKEDDDQRTVVTVRKRNSIRFRHSAADVVPPRVSQRPHFNSHNSEASRISIQPPNNSYNSQMTTSNSTGNFDNENYDTTISESISYDTLSMSSDINSSASPMGSNCSSKEASPLHNKYTTLPPKLDVKQIEWDEIDDLLQVERKQDEADRAYQTMPSPLPSQSSATTNTDTSEYGTAKTSSPTTLSSSDNDEMSKTLSPLSTPESPEKNLLSSSTDAANDADDVFATPTSTLKPGDFEDFRDQVRKDYINGANNMETYDENTLKSMQPIDPRRINDSLKIYNDTVMNKSLTEEQCFNVLALPSNCKITDSFNLKHFYDDDEDTSPIQYKPQRNSYRNYLLQKSESESSTPRSQLSANITPTTDEDPSSSLTLVNQPKLNRSQSGPNYYNSFMNSDDSDTETLKPSNMVNSRSVNIKMDCYDELVLNNNNNKDSNSNNNNSKLLTKNNNHRNSNYNGGSSVISEDKVLLLENEDDTAENNYLNEEGVMLRRRPKGSTAIKRRSGNRRSRTKLKRRCSINGHFYNPETSSFTPPFGSQMSVWVSSLVNTQDVINLLLEKYKVESRAENFALFIMRDNGEQKKVKEEDYPLLVRVLLGPHEDVAKLFLMDDHVTSEISSEVAQFLNLSIPECNSILTRFDEEEERELYKIREKYQDLRGRIVQRMETLKVRL